MAIGNPAALWLLLVIAAWLLLGRHQRARAQRSVGNLYLWSEPASSAPAHVAFRRLRRHWLIFLQAAIMAALVVALARPTFSWRAPRVALVLDVSASMGARSPEGVRIDLARQAARSIVDGLPRGAQVLLLAAGPVPTVLGEYSRAAPGLDRAIGDIVATASSADLPRAVHAARTAGIEPDAIHVISDSPDPSAVIEPVRWVGVGSAAANLAITKLAARAVPGSAADRQLIVTVWNYSGEAHDTVVEVRHDERLLRSASVHLPPRQRETVALDLEDLDGVIEARLPGGDALAGDDRRFAVLAPPPRARVLLVSRGNFFLEKALAVNPSVSLASTGSTSEANDPAVDVVVCDRCESLPAGDSAVLMIPSLRYAGPAPLTVSLPEHPIAGQVAPIGTLAAAGESAPTPPDASIILRAGGHPAILAYERDGRRVVEWRLDLTDSTFTLNPAFPMLFDNVLAWLDARAENATSVLAGEPLHWILRDSGAADGLTVVRPDGSPARASVSGRRLTTTDTTMVGIYEVRWDGTVRSVAVNPVTDGESDLAQGGEPTPPPSAPAERASGTVDLTPFLVVLALTLLTLEWRARSGGRRAA